MVEGASILIVDDEEDLCTTLKDIFVEKGYRVETVGSGREAIERVKEEFFNLAFIDINLPDIDGIEVLKRFRRERPSMMNVMITGYATLENTIQALNEGANAYILKPLEPEKLLRAVEECLKKQEEAFRITQEKISEYIEEAVRRMDLRRRRRTKPQDAT